MVRRALARGVRCVIDVPAQACARGPNRSSATLRHPQRAAPARSGCEAPGLGGQATSRQVTGCTCTEECYRLETIAQAGDRRPFTVDRSPSNVLRAVGWRWAPDAGRRELGRWALGSGRAECRGEAGTRGERTVKRSTLNVNGERSTVKLHGGECHTVNGRCLRKRARAAEREQVRATASPAYGPGCAHGSWRSCPWKPPSSRP